VADLSLILRDKILPQAKGKLRAECNVSLNVTDAAIRRLAEMADSDNFGARELERVFRNHVLLPVAEAAIASRKTTPATNVIMVDRLADGRLKIELQPTAS
jgi:ATP-dependent Clp protease ATP-binding subunit ClpA